MDDGGGGLTSSLDLLDGGGLKAVGSDPTKGPAEKGGGCKLEGGAGLKADASDPATGPDDKNGVVDC